MTTTRNAKQGFPLNLTQAQRKLVAELVPELAQRLKMEERYSRTIQFTLDELKHILRSPDGRWDGHRSRTPR